jgi:hypothetical protein
VILISFDRRFLFNRVKLDFAFRVLQKVSYDLPPPSVSIDRLLLASKSHSSPSDEEDAYSFIKRTVFGIAYEQLKDLDPRLFHIRSKSRFFF